MSTSCVKKSDPKTTLLGRSVVHRGLTTRNILIHKRYFLVVRWSPNERFPHDFGLSFTIADKDELFVISGHQLFIAQLRETTEFVPVVRVQSDLFRDVSLLKRIPKSTKLAFNTADAPNDVVIFDFATTRELQRIAVPYGVKKILCNETAIAALQPARAISLFSWNSEEGKYVKREELDTQSWSSGAWTEAEMALSRDVLAYTFYNSTVGLRPSVQLRVHNIGTDSNRARGGCSEPFQRFLLSNRGLDLLLWQESSNGGAKCPGSIHRLEPTTMYCSRDWLLPGFVATRPLVATERCVFVLFTTTTGSSTDGGGTPRRYTIANYRYSPSQENPILSLAHHFDAEVFEDTFAFLYIKGVHYLQFVEKSGILRRCRLDVEGKTW